jgi:hypothetical protein
VWQCSLELIKNLKGHEKVLCPNLGFYSGIFQDGHKKMAPYFCYVLLHMHCYVFN